MQQPMDLTEAEQRLRAAIRNGQVADFTRDAGELRAEVIRRLCVDTGPNEKIEAKRVWISGATIVGVLDFEGLALSFPLRLTGCVLNERPIFTGAKLDLLDLRGTRCVKGIDAAYLEVTTEVVLAENFSAEGDVRLYGAKIKGDLVCTGGCFANRREPTSRQPVLNLEGATIDGSVFLSRGFTAEGKELSGFAAEGEVRLSRASIGGTLDCSGGSFTKRGDDPALGAIGVDVDASAFLREGFSARGEVSLYEAKIGGNLDCGKASFMNCGDTALNATGAQVGGFLTWREVLSRGRIILEHASANQLADEVTSWPARGQLFLNGFEYKGFAKEAPREANQRLDWLGRQSEFTPQPYEQLVGVLRRTGHEGDARTVAIRKQVRLRKSGLLPWWSRVWSCFLGFVVAHGYRPSRAFLFAAIWVLIGWVIFSNAAHECVMVPAKDGVKPTNGPVLPGTCPPAPSNYPQLVAPVYSLDVFLPVVDLHQEEYWLPNAGAPSGRWYWGYMWAHIVLGWTLTTVLVAALAGLIKKD